ncbi:MAG: hypothetical protein NVS9B14_03880 [Candidatus Acidiferrum sp.]
MGNSEPKNSGRVALLSAWFKKGAAPAALVRRLLTDQTLTGWANMLRTYGAESGRSERSAATR